MTTPEAIATIIVMGVSGAGKSTVAAALAARLGMRFRDGDEFHPPANIAKMEAGIALTDADRQPWLAAIANAIDRAAETKSPVVIACSALKRVYRDALVHGRPDVRIVYLKGSRSLIAERLAERHGHFMPPSLLASQFDVLQEPAPDEPAVTVAINRDVDTIVDDAAGRLELKAREATP